MALSRDNSNKIIAGVCSGIAREYKWDPTLLRLLAVVLALVTGVVPFIIVYVVMWVIMPEDG
ncbi:MAG: hypothetical protein CMJ24_06885 [Phycisphaerae bacterium]|nr:hypothetical protein [Phycisphaerae bacterium]MDG1898537.1 PspC domain-containing protein [Phycisphaerales bacterium]|tara:strand:- start:5760 stop:5945 length:186 start_codon:yes stop_codon:yes gene_type:complete